MSAVGGLVATWWELHRLDERRAFRVGFVLRQHRD